DIVHDKELAKRIFLHGFRPTITDDTPQFYCDLMQKCWHSDPTKRPTAKEIFDLTFNWYFHPTQTMTDQINKAEEIRQRNIEIKKETKIQNPGAIYTSRLMPNISKGKQILDRINQIRIINCYFSFVLELASLNFTSVGIQSDIQPKLDNNA